MEGAKRTYEMLNSELHDDLPALHDSRILFLVTNMQTLFAAEEVFHSETAKVMYRLVKNTCNPRKSMVTIIDSLLTISLAYKTMKLGQTYFTVETSNII